MSKTILNSRRQNGVRGVHNVTSILEWLDQKIPFAVAEAWDPVGLLVGDAKTKVKKVIVSIDLNEEALKLAQSFEASLIVTHHPCIFPKKRGLSRVTEPSLVYQAARRGISVIACHTNFDRCALEVSSQVAKGLGIRALGRLVDPNSETLKLVVFVPETHIEPVRKAICEAGAGFLGHYDHCTFGVQGVGTFRGLTGSQPFLGVPGQIERAKEVRLETLLPLGLKGRVLKALKNSHPYEEIAYDLYPVRQSIVATGDLWGLGYGVWGEVSSGAFRSFSQVLQDVKRLFRVHGFWVSEPAPTRVKRIGFVPGKATSFINAAEDVELDLLITGELGYHAQLEAKQKGITAIELGHRESERFFLQTMGKWFRGIGVKVKVLDRPTQKIRF